MKISIIVIGSLKEDYLKVAQEDLLGKILKKNHISGCTVLELKDEPAPDNASAAQQKQVLDTEGRRILAKLPAHSLIISLDINGKKVGADFFAGLGNELKNKGTQDLVFIIGGSLGISTQVKLRSDRLISFSSLTYPHQLFRIALLDALSLYL